MVILIYLFFFINFMDFTGLHSILTNLIKFELGSLVYRHHSINLIKSSLVISEITIDNTLSYPVSVVCPESKYYKGCNTSSFEVCDVTR